MSEIEITSATTGEKTTTKPDGGVETVEADMIEHRRLRVERRPRRPQP